MDGQGTPLPGMDFAGGSEFPLPGGGIVRSANITPESDTGIGTWTEQQFIDKFKAFDGARVRALSSRGTARKYRDAVAELRRHDDRGPGRHLRASANAQTDCAPGEEAQLRTKN